MAVKKKIQKIKFDVQNSAYQKQAEKYRMWRDIYEGGSAIEDNPSYLIKHHFEPDSQYAIRRKRATYRNFAAPIADIYISAIWGFEPGRRLPQEMQAFALNVDKAGTSVNEFFHEVTKAAAVEGIQFVLVDSGAVPEGVDANILTKAQAEEYGIRPYFIRLPALSIVDWQIGEDNLLDWIVIQQKLEADRMPFSEPTAYRLYTVWSRDSITRYRVESNDVYTMTESRPNRIGIVPIVPFIFDSGPVPFTGTSCLDDVASLILKVFRRDSERDKSLFDCAVALMLT
jgi:hypothetical protein